MSAIININKPSRESVLSTPEAPLGVNLVYRFTMTFYFLRGSVSESRFGWVYLVHAEGTNRYKIGCSKDPKTRHQTLVRQSPYPLVVVTSFSSLDARSDESRLHTLLSYRRVHGEWFEFGSSYEAESAFNSCDRLPSAMPVVKVLSELLSHYEVNILTRQLIEVVRTACHNDIFKFCEILEALEHPLSLIQNEGLKGQELSQSVLLILQAAAKGIDVNDFWMKGGQNG